MDNETITAAKSPPVHSLISNRTNTENHLKEEVTIKKECSGILFLTSYPPRECGIATYSEDLIHALNKKYNNVFKLTICPLETDINWNGYPDDIEPSLNTDNENDYSEAARRINFNPDVDLVVVQHEFGLFSGNENGFQEFLNSLDKPIAITFHTVIPEPDASFRLKVKQIASKCDAIIVMTQTSADILYTDYEVPRNKVTVIPHGTHLVPYADKGFLKEKYNLHAKKVLSTFGLLGSGKSIETTLDALPGIVSKFPETVFLIIGKTHPTLVKKEGEKYRQFLEAKINALNIGENVRFVNQFLPLEELLEYLQLTDVYLFTSKDPFQAVSGTFSYALSCGCPVVSTPIPHALEVLQNNAGIVIDFEDSGQLEQAVIKLLENEELCHTMRLAGLHTSATSAWENAAIAHARIFIGLTGRNLELRYHKPPINLDHIKKMTTEVGIIQFSKINHPDIESGYTLDDNARALIALCQHYILTRDASDLKYIEIYFNFIYSCLRLDGKFLNYVNKEYQFTEQNKEVNLEDSGGRAIWAIGYLISMSYLLPAGNEQLKQKAIFLFEEALKKMDDVHSTRAMAFIIKGLYYYNQGDADRRVNQKVHKYADRLLKMYAHESTDGWRWFESYLTYGNSVLPQALLIAYVMTLNNAYMRVAKESFDFLLSKIFNNGSIRVISNQNWLKIDEKFDPAFKGGEQPIDVAYTILALRIFHKIFPQSGYDNKMEQAFNWFMGENPLRQIVYNPRTGGCYDGLELHNINLNQGAESTISYLLSRMAFEDSTLP